jgi:phage-related protein
MDFNAKVREIDVTTSYGKFLNFSCDVYLQNEKVEMKVTIQADEKSVEMVERELKQALRQRVIDLMKTREKFSLDSYKGKVYTLNTND